MTGRPSSFTQALADEICRRLADGESLRAISGYDHMPSGETVRRWLRDNEAFRAQYARAREDQAHTMAEKTLEAAYEVVENSVEASMARLRYDAHRWFAGKLLPKVYGDKTLHTGADGQGPAVVKIITGVPRDNSDE